jgi:CHAT domain-containing protein
VTGTSWKRRLLLLIAFAVAVYGCQRLWSARPPSPPDGDSPAAQLARADYYAKLGNWDAAGPIFRRLEHEFGSLNDSRDALYSHVSRLEADIESANLQQLSDELAQIIGRPEVQKDLGLKQRCLEVKGRVDLNRDGVTARPSFEELERVAILRQDKDAASRASGELGILSFLEGNSSDASKRVLGAIVHAYWSRDAGAQIRYLSLLGQGMVENHAPTQALLALDRAITIAKRTPGAGFPKIAVSGRASALTQLGRFTEAQQVIELGLNYARPRHYLGYEVDMLAAAGQLARMEGNTQLAINLYLQAAGLAREIHFNRGLAEVDAQLASLYQIAGDLPKAEERARECIQSHRDLGEVYELPHHLAVEANIQAALGDIATAERTFETAERIVGTMLANTPTASVKRAVVSAMSEVFLDHFELAIKQRDLAKAYQVIEEARGRVTADRLWAETDRRRARKPPELTAAERKLALLQIKLLDSTNERDREKLSDSIADAENELSIPSQPVLENAPWRRPALADLQRTIASDETLVEYVVGDDVSHCLAITTTGVEAFRLPSRKVIDALVDHYLLAIKKQHDAKTEGRALYSAILKPVLNGGSRLRVIIIPDGSLYRVPFAALSDDQDRYLLESRTISYAPSGTVFALVRSRTQVVPRELLAVGDVDYGNGFQRGFTNIFREVRELRRDSFKDLPGSGDEVQAVRSALKDVRSVVLSRAQATETNFKRDANRPVTVIHLALHALADSKYPDRAALVFASDLAAGEDGLLQVREIRTLPIAGTSLVTLSACDTSVGRVEGEEGISSIVYAFLYAGARSAVATYWMVEDASTADLMRDFYGELGRGTAKAEALRQAQLQLAHSQTEMHEPFYWAAFNLMGEGSDSIEKEDTR